jgi:hypothetical protein
MGAGVSEGEAELVKVEIRTNDEVETLWAQPLGNSLYRLDNTPWYAYGVSWRDVVEATPQDGGFPLFTRVVDKSGYRTVRVIVRDDAELEQLKAGVLALGCTFEGAWSKLISIDVPAEASLEAVRDFLIDGRFQWEHADPTYEEYQARTAG